MKTWLADQQTLICEQIENNRLPHALLITGCEGAGKSELANWLVQTMLCLAKTKQHSHYTACGQCKNCYLYASQTYPDHIQIVAEKLTIGVDEIRKACRFLEKKSHLGLYKTVIIENAEKMTVAAANALLKTLEEPTEHSLLILLTRDSEMLLPTIISRCQLFNIRPLAGEALLAELGGVSHNSYTNLTHLPELSDQGINERFVIFQQSYLQYLINQPQQDDFLKLLLNTKEAMRWLEKITVNLMRSNKQWSQALLIDPILANQLEQTIEDEQLWQIYQHILAAVKQLKNFTQANNQFVLEKLYTDIKL
jgi:DNA polymerase-3 subunit delta'